MKSETYRRWTSASPRETIVPACGLCRLHFQSPSSGSPCLVLHVSCICAYRQSANFRSLQSCYCFLNFCLPKICLPPDFVPREREDLPAAWQFVTEVTKSDFSASLSPWILLIWCRYCLGFVDYQPTRVSLSSSLRTQAQNFIVFKI